MVDSIERRVLVIVRHSPYGTSLARSSIDAALAAAAFELKVDLLFLGDGVLHLLPGQDSLQWGVRNIGRLIGSLPLYDIERIYVDRVAMERFNLDISRAPVEACVLASQETHELLLQYDHLLGF